MKRLFVTLFLLLFFLIKPQISFAETIHNFDVNIVAHKNGVMDITEIISYDFEANSRHGIYRDIPLYSEVGNLYRIIKIENINILRDFQEEKFTLSKDSRNLNIKIGNANKTITGNHTYTISYRVINGIGSNFEDHDEIYWNITGNNWEVNIEKANAKVETDFDVKPNKLICFEGPTGSKNQTCNVVNNFSSSSQILYPSSGLTIVAVYPSNTFPKSILSKTPPQSTGEKLFNFIFKNYVYILFALNFILAPYLIYWYQKHKNKKRFGPPVVNFDIPKDDHKQILRPALAGTIDSTKLDTNDVVATIFDLAIRKYIKLEETKTSIKFFPDFKDQKIIKLKNADENLNSYEEILYKRFFRDGDNVNVSTLKKDFYKTFSSIKEDVFKNLVEKKYYTKNPAFQKALLLSLAFICIPLGNIILSIVLLFLSLKLNGRTPQGDEMDFKIDGLKIFLKSMGRNYKWQTQNLYTVEQMIPYAMALGFIDKFMKQLKIIKPNYNPTWYSGTSNFYTGYAIFYSGMTSSMTAPTSSSGSSGGFSGGGGGGGGGGSW